MNTEHVVPIGQDHESSPFCGCQPWVNYEDLITGNRVYVHRREHDTARISEGTDR